MSAGEAQRLRQLKHANGRLKQLVADLSLDKLMLKAAIEKKQQEPGLMIRRKARKHWRREGWPRPSRTEPSFSLPRV